MDQIIFENGKLIIYCLFLNKNRSDKFFLDFGSVPPLILRVIYIWIISCKCPKVCQHLANNIFLNHFSYISRIFLFVLRLKYSSDIFDIDFDYSMQISRGLLAASAENVNL